MNERIQELADEALQLVANEHTNGDESRLNTDSYHVKDLIQEKFAELIIQECLAKAEEEEELYRGFSHLGGAEYAKVMYNYQLLLKEHFGVE